MDNKDNKDDVKLPKSGKNTWKRCNNKGKKYYKPLMGNITKKPEIDIVEADREKLEERINVKYYLPNHMLDAGMEYFTNAIERGEVVNVAGLCIYLKVPLSSFYNYKKKSGFMEVVEFFEKMIENTLINTNSKKMSDNFKQFYFKNKFKYVDKIEHENKNLNVSINDNEVDELLEKAKKKRLETDIKE